MLSTASADFIDPSKTGGRLEDRQGRDIGTARTVSAFELSADLSLGQLEVRQA